MSNLLSLDPNNLKAVYCYLSLRDKFELCITNKRLYKAFSKYPLTDIIYGINQKNCLENQFLFNNIVSLATEDVYIDLSYLHRFQNVCSVNLTSLRIHQMTGIIAFVRHLPASVREVHVSDSWILEQFRVANNICNRSFTVKMQSSQDTEVDNHSEQEISTPSHVRDLIDPQIEDLILYKSRMRIASSEPNLFIPAVINDRFPTLPNSYQFVASLDSSPNTVGMTSHNIESFIHSLQQLLVNAIVISQQGNWILVTQIEFYYKDTAFDDVAMVNKHEIYKQQLRVNIEKCQEGRGIWYELRFTFNRFEAIATGGLHNKQNDNKMDAFLGVAAPAHMANDNNFIILSPTEPAPATSCPRMLRNYQKRASRFNWCYKSSFFEDIGFSTPRFLKLYKDEPNSYVAVSSKLISLISKKKYTPSKHKKLKRMLRRTQYYKDLGLKQHLSSKKTLQALEAIESGNAFMNRKPSIGKRLLIQLLLEKHKDAIDERLIMQIYNSIIAPRIKAINQEKVKKLRKCV